MNVTCPHCSTNYTLPERLLGGRGARVRCPMCDEGFEVLREAGGAEPAVPDDGAAEPHGVTVAEAPGGDGPTADVATVELTVAERVAAEASGGGLTARSAEALAAGLSETARAPAAPAPPEAPAGPEDAGGSASRLLGTLAERLGDGLAEARREGRVLAAFGAEIVKVWDEYRKGLGERAAAAEFRAALLERFGVDLSGGRPRR